MLLQFLRRYELSRKRRFFLVNELLEMRNGTHGSCILYGKQVVHMESACQCPLSVDCLHQPDQLSHGGIECGLTYDAMTGSRSFTKKLGTTRVQ